MISLSAFLSTTLLLGAVAVDEVAVKYKDIADGAHEARVQRVADMEHRVTSLRKSRQPFNPAVLFDYVRKHPKQAEVVATLLAGGFIAHETKLIQEVSGMLRGSHAAAAPQKEEAEVEETPEVLETPEAAEEAVMHEEEASEPVAATEASKEAHDPSEGGAHDANHHAHVSEPLTWKDCIHAMKNPVNITKVIVFLVSLVIFFALRKHAHQKAEKHLQKRGVAGHKVAAPQVVGLDGTGGLSTPRV